MGAFHRTVELPFVVDADKIDATYRNGVLMLRLPKPGEQVCGDAWAAAEEGSRLLFLVADGLGHGPQAAEAARAASTSQNLSTLRPI